MAWVGPLIAAVGSIAGGALGASGAKKAANAQAEAARQQLELQRQIYNQGIQLSEPWRATGQGANTLLAQLYGLPYYDYSAPSPIGGGAGSSSNYGIGTGKEQANIFGYSDPILRGIDSMFGGSPTPYRYDKKTGTVIINGANGGRKQMGGYIDPRTGTFVANNDPNGLTNAMNQYLQTGTWEGGAPPKNVSRFIKAADALRQGGWNYESVQAQNNPIAGYHEGTGVGDLSVFENSPGYKFRLNEGLRAVEQSAAARGNAFGGNALRAISDYAQGTAADDFYSFVNQMNNLSGRGQVAVSGQQNAGTSFGNMGGNAIGAAGDARASGMLGAYNAWNNALSQLGTVAGDYYGNSRESGLAPVTVTSRYRNPYQYTPG